MYNLFMIKKYIYTILMLGIFVVFNGCASKEQTLNTASTKTVTPSSSEDSFLDEFESELAVEKVDDPLESYNRFMTNVNDTIYTYTLIPVAKGYKKFVSKDVRTSVGNVFSNLKYPIRVVNNLLQGKFENAGIETGRFLINSTVGILGIFDVAKSRFNLEAKDEDFGQTLGYWGIKSGPHLVLPLLGPSNIRDGISLIPDSYLNPITYYDDRGINLVNNTYESIGVKVAEEINKEANLGIYGIVQKDAIDLYPYLRDAYEQRREKQIGE